MDAHGTYWFLEHVSTGKKLILQSGENSVGRHSCCRIVLKDFDFLSRQHANFVVSDENLVSIQQLNALNGVFINEARLTVNQRSLSTGDRIGLGVQVESWDAVVPPNYAIFQLKQMCPKKEDIILISDDEDNDKTPPRPTNAVRPNHGPCLQMAKPEMEKPEVDKIADTSDKTATTSSDKRSIHLPKLPDVKQEILSQKTKEIENIFGEPNEVLLESVLQINPYIYKQLNTNNIDIGGEKIRDGDVIEVPEELKSSKSAKPELTADVEPEPSSAPEEDTPADEQIVVGNENDDYDENFALSQAVLREMKEELADAQADLSDEDQDNQQGEEPFSPKATWVKTEIATQIDDDEIILIDDEDDELYNKVADWSSKLLTQNLMSQVYPLDEGEQSNDANVVENDVQVSNIPSVDDNEDSQDSELQVIMRRKSRALRIDSSEDEASGDDQAGNADLQDPKIRKCSVRVKSMDLSNQPKNNNQELEVVLVPGSSVPDNKLIDNNHKEKPAPRKRRKTCYIESPCNSPTKSSDPKPDSSAEKADEISLTRLKNRSKSVEDPQPEQGDLATPLAEEVSPLTRDASTSKTDNSKNNEGPERDVEGESSNKKTTEAGSSYTRALSSNAVSALPASRDASARNDENRRGPAVIKAPHLPKCRGKLRGVSAKEDENKEKVLERQRLADYKQEMKGKWFKKSTDKKIESKEIKEKRREELKKLAEKAKSDATSSRSNDRKRKTTSVPTLSNCNRGDFLTKEVNPPAKKTKPNPSAPKTAQPSKPVTPKRRATIESFSQQLSAMDLIKNLPTPRSRPRERKDAEEARSKRTLNRVTFAEMERDFEWRQELERRVKSKRRVRFNDNVQIIIIDRIEGAFRKVGNTKDTKKVTLSTYAERRSWSQAQGRLENLTDLIMGNILSWGNQWLKLRSADAVAEMEVLIPMPSEFKSYKEYKDIVIPLMKLELLTTIERDYKASNKTFDVQLKVVTNSSARNRPRFVLTTKCSNKNDKRYDLYTLSSGNKLKETFASLARVQRIAGNVYELCFEVLQEGITVEMLNSCKTFTVRPVVDNIRVEMGAFNAIYLMGRSPLFQRILQPSKNVLSYDNKILQQAAYKGFRRMNDHQMDICQRTWSRLIDDSTPSITLIQGPPGTGKSVVISNLTLQCMYGSCNLMLDRKILICAHSNAAVDNITGYLKRAHQAMTHSKFNLLRFGVFEKMDQNVRDVSLDAFLGRKLAEKRGRLSAENIESLTRQREVLEAEIAEIRKLPAQVNYIQQQLDGKEKQLRLVMQQLKPQLTPREEHEFSMMALQQANIVCTTLSSCIKLATFIDYFDACIIDEATQCTEPWTLLPLRFGVRGLVLVGDTQQLPATVLSQKAIDFGLGNSMFDRIQRNLKQQLDKPHGNHFVHTKMFKLSMQYRMHPEICRWPNSYFYENLLVNSDCTHRLISPFIPYCVINLGYTRDTNDAHSRSISNDEEARFVALLLVEMDKLMPVKRFTYGLITPYSSHCYALSQAIPSQMKITPHTIDAYQGQERDIVILSNARTRGVGFLTNYQRLNVAITRPRRNLIICGNFDDLEAVTLWRHLLDDARKRNVYFNLERGDVDNLTKSLISKIQIKPIQISDHSASPPK